MKTNRLRLLPDKDTVALLKTLGDRVSALWNVGNYTCRQVFLKGGRVPGYEALCAQLKDHPDYRALPSDVAQEVLKYLAKAWKSYFALRENWQSGELRDKPGLPKYRKNRRTGKRPTDWIPVKSPRAYAIDAQRIALTLPADLRTQGRLQILYRGLRRYVGLMRTAEVCFDRMRGRWYFHYRVETPEREPRPWDRSAAIDLGIRVAASLSIEGASRTFHFSARELLKEWDYWNRRIAEHMAELAHRPAGERSSRRLRRLYHQRGARIEHGLEAMSARIIALLKAYRVGVAYVGWPKDIRRDKHLGKRWNGRLHNFWSFDKALRILEQHCNRAGILMIRADEKGTSKHCPECGSPDVVRRPRHVLSCKACGTRMHSDQAGSMNILRKHHPNVVFSKTPGTSRDGAEAALKPETLRWNKHRWVDASNPLGDERLAA